MENNEHVEKQLHGVKDGRLLLPGGGTDAGTDELTVARVNKSPRKPETERSKRRGLLEVKMECVRVEYFQSVIQLVGHFGRCARHKLSGFL